MPANQYNQYMFSSNCLYWWEEIFIYYQFSSKSETISSFTKQ